MDPAKIGFGLAFLAGLASFLSPCVLSLVPAYVGYLSSRAVTVPGCSDAVITATVATPTTTKPPR